MIRRVQHHQALRPLVRPRLCRCDEPEALPQSSLPRVHPRPSSVSAQRPLTILSMSCICGNSTVFSHILKLVLISFVVVTSRRCSDLSRPARWNARYCSPLSRHQTVDLDCGRRCRQHRAFSVACSSSLILTCLWVRSFPPAVGPLFSLLLHSALQSRRDFSLFSSVRRAVHDVLTGELFACVQHGHSRAARGLLD